MIGRYVSNIVNYKWFSNDKKVNLKVIVFNRVINNKVIKIIFKLISVWLIRKIVGLIIKVWYCLR